MIELNIKEIDLLIFLFESISLVSLVGFAAGLGILTVDGNIHIKQIYTDWGGFFGRVKNQTDAQ